ncbi:TIGR00730 family Rossman fold protein [Petroclostridium sp. X23]|uniref:LOG family protein n=1 Tax=Petroclostridium sp. X23 TaxID=3045146 RepID=UPI0024AD3329|nr:TIGR00730 family Rossman fold protein [Petroclostridium sp. X23]WHH61485.1 TIGR00730 family Rossman fold protein [Petroclostridium sp. X23]
MTVSLSKICIFCGSSFGKNTQYKEQAQKLGKHLALNNIELVYGGGNVGLMGELARSVLEGEGKVTGVIPKKLYDMVDHVELTELHIVDNMHQRKAKMYDLADGFIALPGGIGTLEELAEVFTWYQLGYHQKPVGILNINNFFDSLMKFLGHMTHEGFLKHEHEEKLIIANTAEELIDKMLHHQAVKLDKWVK